ncbi:sensor histidine kinase [Ectothiorhodospiraceae bacterium BW-2]|nr:sensor histidine kinase [Ectothiorhodospiraceae bacterium BW-2]
MRQYPYRSLKRRLQAGLFGSLLLVLLLLYLGLNQLLLHLYQQEIITRLHHDTEMILQAVDPVNATVTPNRIAPIYQRPLSGHYYQIDIAEHPPLRSRSLWDEQLPQVDLATGSEQQSSPHLATQQLLALSQGFTKQGIALTITVAEDIYRSRELRQQLLWLLAAAALVSLLLLTAVQLWVVQGALATLKQIKQQLQALQQGKQQQLRLEQIPAEIAPLAQELNQLLQQQAERLQRSRHAVGNLAHALKTPLNRLLLFGHEPLWQHYPEQRQHYHQALQQIHHHIDRELKRARLAGRALPGHYFKPAQELPLLRQLLLQIYADRQLTLELNFPPEPELALDRDDMVELLGNLLDNGCKWARSRIVCTLSQQGDKAIIFRIADDGSGCTTEMLTQIAQRGLRLDEQQQGSGLGLAIVSDIVKLYHGELTFTQAAEGGLEVTVKLPLD